MINQEQTLPPDQLNSIGVLTRREVEARILAPLIKEFSDEFGWEKVKGIVQRVITEISREQGFHLAASLGGHSLEQFTASLEAWNKDDAMQIEVLEQNELRFFFDVHRCRYAEMYQALGVPELGVLLSCNRDHALIEGFNPQISLTRTQTIMEGGSYCDFRFEMQEGEREK